MPDSPDRGSGGPTPEAREAAPEARTRDTAPDPGAPPWLALGFLALALVLAAAGAWLLSRPPAGRAARQPANSGGTASGTGTAGSTDTTNPGASASAGAVRGVLSLLVADPHRSLEADYHLFAEIARETGWNVLTIQPGQAIPPGSTVLAIFGGALLSSGDAARIADYRAAGGGLLIMAGGVDILAAERLSAQPRAPDALDRLLAGSGVSIERSLVLDAAALPAPFESAPGGGPSIHAYHHWFSASGGTGQGASAQAARLFWPSPVRAGTGADTILRASASARIMDAGWTLDPPDVARWFAAGRGRSAPETALGVALETRGSGRLAVIGSVDFVSSLIEDTGSRANPEFALRILDWLSRARTSPGRP